MGSPQDRCCIVLHNIGFGITDVIYVFFPICFYYTTLVLGRFDIVQWISTLVFIINVKNDLLLTIVISTSVQNRY